MLGVASNEDTLQLVEELFSANTQAIESIIAKNHKNGTNLTRLLKNISNTFLLDCIILS